MASRALVYLSCFESLYVVECKWNSLSSLENVVEFLFESSRLCKWPVGVFLMAENNVLKDGFRNTQ